MPTNEQRDQAECLYCKCKVSEWTADIDPLDAHRKAAPKGQCMFLKHLDGKIGPDTEIPAPFGYSETKSDAAKVNGETSRSLRVRNQPQNEPTPPPPDKPSNTQKETTKRRKARDLSDPLDSDGDKPGSTFAADSKGRKSRTNGTIVNGSQSDPPVRRKPKFAESNSSLLEEDYDIVAKKEDKKTAKRKRTASMTVTTSHFENGYQNGYHNNSDNLQSALMSFDATKGFRDVLLQMEHTTNALRSQIQEFEKYKQFRLGNITPSPYYQSMIIVLSCATH